MGARGSAIPRSVYPLLILLVVAALWLWRGGGEPTGPRLVFDTPIESIQACAVQGPNGLTTLERTPDGWRLDGVSPDLADVDGVTALLNTLTATLRTDAVGDADWRASSAIYGLEDAGIFSVSLATDDDTSRLRIGVQNPATGLFYATGAGSDALFMVGEDLVGNLNALPSGVRARILWPGFGRDDPDTLRLRFADHDDWDLAARDLGGRWWLRMPADGWSRTGRVARDYHRQHADRRKTEAGAEWLRLRDREVANLLAYLEDARVRDFLGPETTPPTRAFAVRVAGRESHEVIFGELESENRAQAWRDGYAGGVVLPGEIPRECAGGLPQYLHTDLLDRGLATADSFALSRMDLGLVRFVNTEHGWELTHPTDPPNPRRMKLMATDLVHFLDRLAVERVYESTPDNPQSQPQTTIQIWATGPGVPPLTVIRCGLHTGTGRPTAWLPAEGRLVEIDRNLAISCQSVLGAAVGRKR
jgi:hypothetical protein